MATGFTSRPRSGTPPTRPTNIEASARRRRRRVETEFLARFGRLQVVEEITTDSSALRDEAVALARLTLDKIRDAQDAAEDDEEEERLFDAYREAKKALRTAEALPTESVTSEVETGETFAQVWEHSNDAARADLLLRVGPRIVEPGRLPTAEEVHLPGTEPDYLAGQTD